jgi:hypothetical protein
LAAPLGTKCTLTILATNWQRHCPYDRNVITMRADATSPQVFGKFLFLAFFNFFEARGGNVLAPLRLQIRPGKFREPDLLLLLAASDPRGQNRFWLGADVALEVVSEDKPARDLVDKRGDMRKRRLPSIGSSTRGTRRSLFSSCSVMHTRKRRVIDEGNRLVRCCVRTFPSKSPRSSM